MGLWLLKLSLALAMGLTAASASQLAKSAVTATPQEHHHAGHAQHQMVSEHADHADHAAHSAHSAHADNTVDHTADKTAVGELDSAHCTAHADCHHCCPLAWGHWASMGMQAAPTQPPARQVAQWHSASWLPALRPPNA